MENINENKLSPEIEELRFYYELMEKSNLLELEAETSLGKVILKRSYLEAPISVSSPSVQTVLPTHRKKIDTTEDKKEAVSSHSKTINAPISGVFYRSSSPQSAPFCKEGDVAKSGSTLCIVEAMKVMNQVKADTNYKIVKVLVENAKPVSQGQALFSVEPA